jgi:hypothetical protein
MVKPKLNGSVPVGGGNEEEGSCDSGVDLGF